MHEAYPGCMAKKTAGLETQAGRKDRDEEDY
jgi:hypothetical protein